MYNVIDLFCGAGGLSLGFEMAGFNILAGFEIEPKFLDTYKSSHPNTIGFNEDLNNVNITELLNENKIDPNTIDVVIGGPPCQGFSTVGNRMIDDPRNNLVRIYANIVKEIKPKIFLMENVSGLESMKNGKGELIKDELIEIFNEIGYNVKSKVLLAADYGVPQLRKRIFFVGIKKDYEYNFKFPTPTYYDKNSLFAYSDNSKKYITVKEAISDLPVIECKESSQGYDKDPSNDYQRYCRGDCTTLFNHKAPNHSELVIERIKNIPQGGNHSDLPEHLKLKRGYPNIYGKLDENKPADTITGNCGCASAPGRFLHPTSNRVITVREACRLQSIPDFVEFKGSNSQQYKQVGNAVPPLLAKAIALEIKNSLLELK
jgi:DNA (cytosine-5)-methyltransferase 1